MRRFCSKGREAESIPASRKASVAAARANGNTRDTCLRSRFSTQASSSKSRTSPAICTEISDGSKREIRRTPLRPCKTPSVKAAFPTPLGLTVPMPVITTRRFTAHPLLENIYDLRLPIFNFQFLNASTILDAAFASDEAASGERFVKYDTQSPRSRV